MARFNVETKKAKQTINYEKGVAFEPLTAQSDLYARVATCLVKEPKFYGSADEEFKTLLQLITFVANQEPELVLQLAAYARNILHLRSVPMVMLGMAALDKHTRGFVRVYCPSIVRRADELAEVIAFVTTQIGNIGDEDKKTMLPMALKKGLRDTFNRFNEYQFAKYDRSSANVSMRDVIRLVHPKPRTEEQKILYAKIAKGKLESADTWEVLISAKGSTTEHWEAAVDKMPIMATLRNLRNLLDKGVSNAMILQVIEKLTNEEIILNSKQFPFRFLSAYRAIEGNDNKLTGKVLSALDRAMFLSIKNLPLLDGSTAIFCDNSGSMSGRVSSNSELALRDVGSVMGAIASLISPDNLVGAFADKFSKINFSDRDSILTRAQKINNLDVGGSTYAHLAFDYLLKNGFRVNRIFLFSDMQCYDKGDYTDSIYNSWQKYKAKVAPNCYLYSFDLAGYGTTQVPEEDPHVLTVAGWSESILKYVPYFEQNRETVLAEIRKIDAATYLNKNKEQE